MYLTPELYTKLNIFGTPEGAAALEALANHLYEMYARETILADAATVQISQGAGRVALMLKTLPKGLRDYGRHGSN